MDKSNALSLLRLMMKYAVACMIMCLVAESALAAKQKKQYPAIIKARTVVSTNPSAPRGEGRLIIRDVRGRPAYELSIIALSLDGRTTESVHLQLSTTGQYSPDPDEEYEPNLLNPDRWGHGEGAWVINPEGLCPANYAHPVLGARRAFTLRRMRITVLAADYELSPNFCPRAECGEQIGGLSKMRLTVTVEPDTSRRGRPPAVPSPALKRCR